MVCSFHLHPARSTKDLPPTFTETPRHWRVPLTFGEEESREGKGMLEQVSGCVSVSLSMGRVSIEREGANESERTPPTLKKAEWGKNR